MPKLQQPTTTNSKKSKKDVTKNGSPTSESSSVKPLSKQKKSRSLPPREILYPTVTTSISTNLSAEKARKLLGWHEAIGPEFLFTDFEDKKIVCDNNVKNRPFYMNSVCLPLVQEILRGKWQLNCENRIIGKTGLVLNGQHTLVALVLAAQKWHLHQGQYSDVWEHEPTIATLVAFGADESDDVVNTMDTCKPRSLEDVIYRSEYFVNSTNSTRRKASKILAHAVKMLWHRTGAALDAFAPRRTHAESLDFITRHNLLLKCVNHIMEENGDEGRIRKYLTPGYAAAFMYLMASATSERCNDDKTGYSDVSHPSEALLDFATWDKASEFWVLLASGGDSMVLVKEAIAKALSEGNGNISVRMAIIAKAWNVWADGHDEMEAMDLELEYVDDEDGYKKLTECPTVGGVDLGNPKS